MVEQCTINPWHLSLPRRLSRWSFNLNDGMFVLTKSYSNRKRWFQKSYDLFGRKWISMLAHFVFTERRCLSVMRNIPWMMNHWTVMLNLVSGQIVSILLVTMKMFDKASAVILPASQAHQPVGFFYIFKCNLWWTIMFLKSTSFTFLGLKYICCAWQA